MMLRRAIPRCTTVPRSLQFDRNASPKAYIQRSRGSPCAAVIGTLAGAGGRRPNRYSAYLASRQVR
jgi:hypothetical protein